MRALLLVDIQNDFLPGGALAVPRGDEVIAVANRLAPAFPLVVASQDLHPPDHASFAAQHPGKVAYDVIDLDGAPQTLWPAHCVQGTPGADLAADLDRARIGLVVQKGTDRRVDSYSAFFDNHHARATGLEQALRARGVHDLCVLGLATDYCVRATVLDARALGFAVTVVEDGCRAVDLAPGDGARALDEMARAGARRTTSDALLASRART